MTVSKVATPIKKTLTISELTFAIKAHLEPSFRHLSIQGEISNFKHQSSGHLYFSLKDPYCQISAVMFKTSAASLARLPKAGDQVVVKGEISIYPPRGNYQLIVREMEFLGLGELLAKLQKLKEELKNRGWFAQENKKPLPKIPKTIGIITSPTGAVIQDVLHVLERRFKTFQLILYPVKVQGEGASEEIAKAIYEMNRFALADVLIVGRGGGSIEDLWPFNEEIVVKAIYESKIPVISAVGHETDYTLSDLAADVRAPTPSAAAELAISEKEHLLQTLLQKKKQTENLLRQKLTFLRASLQGLTKQPAFSSSQSLLGKQMQQIDDLSLSLTQSLSHLVKKKEIALSGLQKHLHALSPLTKINFLREKLSPFRLKIESALILLLSQRKKEFKSLTEHLFSIDPKNLLKKGYSILFSEKSGSIILSASEVSPGERIKTVLKNGAIVSTVDKIEKVSPS